jgi:hypothetical protein
MTIATGFNGVLAGLGVYRVGNYGCFARCTNNHKVFPCKLVKGTYSKDHACDSRCLNARGWSCTCSCGGANHGRGHVATVVQAADLNDREHFPGRSLRPEFAVPHTVEDYAPVVPIKRHIGEVGKTIKGAVRIVRTSELTNGKTLYAFETVVGGHLLKWYAPSYADPQWEPNRELTIRARVRAHDMQDTIPVTVVTYVEEVEYDG